MKKTSDNGATGIPTARNVHHVGFTVPNLDAAIEFFTGVLGSELLFRTGPFEDPEGDFMSRNLNVDAKASLNIAMLRCGPVTNVELLEWDVLSQCPEHPRNSDIGAGHLAFHVTDMAAAVAYLRDQPSVTVLGEPVTVEEGQPSAGSEFIYFLTPWGLQLELLAAPPDMPYTSATTGRLYGPAASWTVTDELVALSDSGPLRDGRQDRG
jgi:catechol 2,3-dioxygenase-like lactoylglutathione lyase family enzyme